MNPVAATAHEIATDTVVGELLQANRTAVILAQRHCVCENGVAWLCWGGCGTLYLLFVEQ